MTDSWLFVLLSMLAVEIAGLARRGKRKMIGD